MSQFNQVMRRQKTVFIHLAGRVEHLRGKRKIRFKNGDAFMGCHVILERLCVVVNRGKKDAGEMQLGGLRKQRPFPLFVALRAENEGRIFSLLGRLLDPHDQLNKVWILKRRDNDA